MSFVKICEQIEQPKQRVLSLMEDFETHKACDKLRQQKHFFCCYLWPLRMNNNNINDEISHRYNIPFKGFNFTQIITLCLSAANLYGEIIGVKNNKHNDDQRNEKNVKIAFRFCTLLLLSNCCHSPNLKTIARKTSNVII